MTKTALIHRLGEIDVSLCQRLNRASRFAPVRVFFIAVSRLGDGVFWYALMAAIALLDRERGYRVAIQMLVTGAAGLLVYKLLKSRTVRPRPFAQRAGILLCTQPLDRYSFPSGHTLHAFSFGMIACAYYPPLYFPLGIFAVLIALSRMVLA